MRKRCFPGSENGRVCTGASPGRAGKQSSGGVGGVTVPEAWEDLIYVLYISIYNGCFIYV